jgi:peptide/nickel transport system permease protein
VYVRYVTWLANIAQGNLGRSYINSQPVSLRIGERVVPTFSLMLSALALSFLVAVPVGVLSALRRYSVLDYASTPFALLGVSVPVPFLGLAAIYVVSLKLHVLPTGGLSTAGAGFSLGDRLSHLLLPAAVLGLHELGSIMRYTRSSVLEVVEQDYVRTARAKGVPAVAVVVRHVLRNALLPLVTLVGLSLPRLFGGAIIAEQIFQWPGMGRLAIEAILARDYPVLMGLNLMTAVLVLAGNLVADVTYALVDPRVRLTR